MRYAYGITSALLVAGSAIALATGHPVGAQDAQNSQAAMQRAMPAAGAPASFADLTEQLQPAVVNISTRQRVKVQTNNPFAGTPFGDLFGNRGGGDGSQTREAQSLGSGFIISSDGYVVTNNHVISAGTGGTVESITVLMPDRSEYEAKLIGKDPQSDLAVLKINRDKPFPFVHFGDSTKARVGDWVLAIGNPLGLGGTVTSGIVSALYRNVGPGGVDTGGAYDRFIQTDASINSGNSGGPMFDLTGSVIGINTAILSPTGGSVGIGFAIPSEVASPIVDKLKAGQTIERGYLGVQLRPLDEDLALSLGLKKNAGEFIAAVEPGGGAEKAGIKPGDVIVEVAGKEVTLDQNLSYIVANTKPGDSVPIELIRNGKRMAVRVSVGQRPSEEELAQSFTPDTGNDDDFSQPGNDSDQAAAENPLGMSVVALTPRIAQQLRINADTQGVVIVNVDSSTDAGTKGFRRGDVIVSINNQPVTAPGDLSAAVSQAVKAGREAVLLRVQRGARPPAFVPVRLRSK